MPAIPEYFSTDATFAEKTALETTLEYVRNQAINGDLARALWRTDEDTVRRTLVEKWGHPKKLSNGAEQRYDDDCNGGKSKGTMTNVNLLAQSACNYHGGKSISATDTQHLLGQLRSAPNSCALRWGRETGRIGIPYPRYREHHEANRRIMRTGRRALLEEMKSAHEFYSLQQCLRRRKIRYSRRREALEHAPRE